MTNLTKSELRVLRVLDSAPDKTEELNGIRLLVKLTRRGIWLVVRRLEERNMVAISYTNHNPISLTFGGMKALKAEQVSA
jgi:DNA-binding MarR family transcriptional regulator